MEPRHYSFVSKVWQYPGFGGWHFLNVPLEISEEIKVLYGSTKKRGWGSVPVNVTIGTSTWKTSIFPGKEGEYLLPLKQSVRDKESITESSEVGVALEVLG